MSDKKIVHEEKIHTEEVEINKKENETPIEEGEPQEKASSPATTVVTAVASKPKIIFAGCDNHGAKYKSQEDMWAKELSETQKDGKEKKKKKTEDDEGKEAEGWYDKSYNYWASVPASMSGVLGGLDYINDRDIRETIEFLALGEEERREKNSPKSNNKNDEHNTSSSSSSSSSPICVVSSANFKKERAIDCGAGIGRLTKAVLCPLGFQKVDLLEPLPHMLEQAKKELESVQGQVGSYILDSLQSVHLPAEHYDLVYIQWVAIYLSDADFIQFFANCKSCLKKPHGFIFFKENCTSGGSKNFVVDKDDSSLTRCDEHYKMLFEAAGLRVMKQRFQKDWPKDLFPVKMYALQ